MKKYIIALLMIAFCVSGSSACASNVTYSHHLELLQQTFDEAFDGSCENKMRLALVEANISYLESCALKKAKRLEARLIAYQNKLGKIDCAKKIEVLLAKVTRVETKLNEMNEVILGIELLKSRLVS